jgi:hypothetical protein
MPADVWYGADCEIRIGRRANAATAPTTWQAAEFMQLTVNPTQERRERNKLGVPGTRHNSLDPIKSRKAFFRLTAELVLDLDSRQLPIWLRYAMGEPAAAVENTENAELFDHVWSSGSKAEQYFDIQVKVGAADVRIYEGLTLGTLAASVTGENTQDFDLNMSLRGLRRRKAAAFEGSAPTEVPAEAPMLRALYLVDDVAADNTLNASFTYDRALSEGLFLSPTPTISSNRPNAGSGHSMSATFRAVGATFDEIEEEDTIFSAAIDFIGVEEDHRIRLEQPQSMLAPGSLPISGAGMIERTFNSTGHQNASTPATVITVTNDQATYA